jgi:hypothetical protein
MNANNLSGAGGGLLLIPRMRFKFLDMLGSPFGVPRDRETSSNRTDREYSLNRSQWREIEISGNS